MIRRFVRDERGMETVEYAVFGALLMAATVVGSAALWDNIQTKFTSIAAWILAPA